MSSKLDLVIKSRTLDISVSRSHFYFQVHPISFENMVNSIDITVDMTVHINPIIISVFSSPGNITIFVMTLMATFSS